MKLKGIGASKGVAYAKIYKLEHKEVEIKETKITDIEGEIKKFDNAMAETVKQIEEVKAIASKNLGPEEAAVFDAHMQVASDPSLQMEVHNMIKNDKANALFATNAVMNNFAAMFEMMDDAYMKERAADIKDVAKRLLSVLAGIKVQNLAAISEEVIIVGVDLTPSDTAQLNKKFVKGFVTDIGGRTSHAAIMARSMEIPAVLGLKNVTTTVKENDFIMLDGDSGEVSINPTDAEIKQMKEKEAILKKEYEENQKFKGKASQTKDGKHLELASNIGSVKDAEGAVENDAEGIGLFRSEFLYMDAKDWPTEDEQYESYKAVLEKMAGKRVVVRTLDIGGDKTLDYFQFPEEMNPFLGYRAIRLCLDKKDIFETQLKALLRASVHGKLAIMFPMIATIDEFLEAKEEIEKAKKILDKEGKKYSNEYEVGMMVEIPATAAIARQFARHADFFSIGTNDLMQYTMAADRMSEKVSYLYQPLNPSILNLINMAIKGAHAEGKWIGMCGEMAGDKNAIPLLVGMGLDEFSMSATSILAARNQISKIDFKEAEKLAEKALNASTQAEVQKLVAEFNK